MYPPVLGCVSLLEEVVQAPGLHGCVVGVEGRCGEVLGRQLHPPPGVAVKVSLASIPSHALCLGMVCPHSAMSAAVCSTVAWWGRCAAMYLHLAAIWGILLWC